LVLTVDHGLREASAHEALAVKAQATSLGLPHKTLVWSAAPPTSGLQAAARDARYALMRGFLLDEARRLADGSAPRRLVTAHHRDDQAETVLMRLARGSGADGLSGMRDTEVLEGPVATSGDAPPLLLVRPFLAIPKARLVATLRARGIAWIEDPSNQISHFERTRVRRALPLLEELGIAPAAIARSARRISRARAAIAAGCAEAARRITRLHGGLFAEIEAAALVQLPEEYVIRIIASLAVAYGNVASPARLSQVEELVCELLEAVREDRRFAATIGGCRVEFAAPAVMIWREQGREPLPEIHLQPGASAIWDQRFRMGLAATAPESLIVRALGKSWRTLPLLADLAVAGLPRGALETTPAFWQSDGRLIAIPCLPGHEGKTQVCQCEFAAGRRLPWRVPAR
jgi:tRNA(Ile)-lysidine synthase